MEKYTEEELWDEDWKKILAECEIYKNKQEAKKEIMLTIAWLIILLVVCSIIATAIYNAPKTIRTRSGYSGVPYTYMDNYANQNKTC